MAGGRTAVRAMLHRHQMHLSPLDTQKKKRTEDFGDSHSQVLGTMGESRGALGNTPGS